ncbi:MAG: type II toxin-antitoxin system RelE/ParE family toxin [Verrucomicrobiota bacterium]|jgi:hypothetical protein
MTVLFHPEFPGDIRKFEVSYLPVSKGLAARFRKEVEDAVEAIQTSPRSAGHLLGHPTSVPGETRRRNLRDFPFFVLYGIVDDRLIFGAIIPSRSDPLTWLVRFSGKE